MTKISYIAGPESAQRAAEVKPAPFIPYLSLTKGEMTLALMQEQASLLANYYGSAKYRDAESMLQNSLYRGIHGATPYLGAYNPELRGLAKVINQARRETAPASKAAFFRPQGVVNGVHVGEPIIDYDARGKECQKIMRAKSKSEKDYQNLVKECEQTWRIEKILNDGIENCGQYLAYGYLPGKGINALPPVAVLKIKTQEVAQQDIARVGKFDLGLTQQWLNVGMMRKNVEVAKVQPYGWTETNAILTDLPPEGQKELLNLLQKSRGGTLSQTEIGQRVAAIVKKYKGVKGIGLAPVAIAIIGAVTALIGAITEFAKEAKAEQNDAFSQVNGFGTRGIGPEEGDWDADGIPNNQDTTPKGESAGVSPLLLVGGAAALYLLAK